MRKYALQITFTNSKMTNFEALIVECRIYGLSSKILKNAFIRSVRVRNLSPLF